MSIESRLEARFLRYVAIDSQSAFNQEQVPSTPGQLQLAHLLHDELIAMGISDCEVDSHGILTAKIPANLNADTKATAIGFVAHLDTVDVGLSSSIKPQKIHYTGQSLCLNSELNIEFDKTAHPEINQYLNDDIFFSDGTSVLGADDKAAISVVMEMAQHLLSHDIPHGDIYLAFVPDEEVGLKGVKLIDLQRFFPEYAYTIDCCECGEIVYETFNAAHARIDIKGVTAHPMSAKNVLVNPILVAKHIIDQCDPLQRPEHTEGREGYIWFTDMQANAARAHMDAAIRDHDVVKFTDKKQVLTQAVARTQASYPSASITLEITDTYANIANTADANHPAVKSIYTAFKQLDVTPKTIAMRGGTDGSALSAMGIVTPNYFTGAHNFHSKFEFLPMSSFVKSYQVTLSLVAQAVQMP
ncbi:peptidase T [Shewanella sp. SNU WT4]|uniref:peptidase T n=1 Tax=Shewanella sp. SNU WT4 TaxID=2590015 RepID=UPI00112D3FBE|nr:peptidase T [Shewanella sp. SNU WT4]QDF66562.1 peptidase T [Shewanella sp. SNU WT4]